MMSLVVRLRQLSTQATFCVRATYGRDPPTCIIASRPERRWYRSASTSFARHSGGRVGRPRPGRSAETLSATAQASPPPQGSIPLQNAEPLEWDEPALQPEAEPEGVFVLPAPSHSRVKTADFVKSSTAVSQCPPAKHPEFAVIGRSNVGKSSLINMLTGKKALAQISKTPGESKICTVYCCSYSTCQNKLSLCHAGKTKCINHFIINNSWFLVDLPGYGWVFSTCFINPTLRMATYPWCCVADA